MCNKCQNRIVLGGKEREVSQQHIESCTSIYIRTDTQNQNEDHSNTVISVLFLKSNMYGVQVCSVTCNKNNLSITKLT